MEKIQFLNNLIHSNEKVLQMEDFFYARLKLATTVLIKDLCESELVEVLSPSLLQATRAPAIANVKNNFFIVLVWFS